MFACRSGANCFLPYSGARVRLFAVLPPGCATDILARLDAIQRLTGGAELSSAYKNIKMEVLSIAVCLSCTSNDIAAMIVVFIL